MGRICLLIPLARCAEKTPGTFLSICFGTEFLTISNYSDGLGYQKILSDWIFLQYFCQLARTVVMNTSHLWRQGFPVGHPK